MRYNITLSLLLLIVTTSAMQQNQSKSCTAGVVVIDGESKELVMHNPHLLFPMASVRKIMLASFVLTCVENREFSLDDVITIRKEDVVPGSGIIKDELHDKSVEKRYTLKKLVKLMLTVSDNTAADKLLGRCGGYARMDNWLYFKQYNDIHFRTTLKTWIYTHARNTIRYREAQEAILKSKNVPYWMATAAQLASLSPEPPTIDFSHEDTNVATPHAIAHFLRKLYAGETNTKEHTQLLLKYMRACKTGDNRIRKYLSSDPAITICNKTGSGIVGICNDCAIIEREGKQPLFMSICVKDSVERMSILEEHVAKIARDAYNQCAAKCKY